MLRGVPMGVRDSRIHKHRSRNFNFIGESELRALGKGQRICHGRERPYDETKKVKRTEIVVPTSHGGYSILTLAADFSCARTLGEPGGFPSRNLLEKTRRQCRILIQNQFNKNRTVCALLPRIDETVPRKHIYRTVYL